MVPSKLAGKTIILVIIINIIFLSMIDFITMIIIMIMFRQMLAILVTLLFALGGGALTGLLMMCVARIQVNIFVIIIVIVVGIIIIVQKKEIVTKIRFQNSYNKQQNNAIHLVLNTTQSIVYPEDLPKEQLFDDAFFFQVNKE